MSGPSDVFAEAAASAGFELDGAQTDAAHTLSVALRALRRRRFHLGKADRARGVYLWGPAGRGKTWLMDVFYAAAATPRKRRIHVHSFFRDLHAGVHAHRRAAHPFEAALAELLHGVDLLCFDELHVHDVGDAMFLQRLLQSVTTRDLTLVATSNYRPRDLLPNPLYHHMFEPGIALIEEALEIVAVDRGRDYRAPDRNGRPPAAGFRAGAFLHVRAATGSPDARFAVPLAGGRQLRAHRLVDDEITICFAELCRRPVSAADYLRLTERFTRWQLTDVPPLRDQSADVRQRFVHLVDVLHDADVSLTLTAGQDFEETFAGEALAVDFARTFSRLRLLRRPEPPQTCEANWVR